MQKYSVELEKWKEERQNKLDKNSAIQQEIAQQLEGLMVTRNTMSDQLIQQSDCLSDMMTNVANKKQAMLQVPGDKERIIDKL